jgi:hypothetical protein
MHRTSILALNSAITWRRNLQMTDLVIGRKSVTLGEGGSAIAFAALALVSIFVAANAYTPEYAFHMLLLP